MSIPEVCITLDVDWAPEKAIEYVAEILSQYHIPATFFATHESQVLKELESPSCEIGLHPNFLNVNKDYLSELQRLKNIYPNACGGRSHGLFVSSPILTLYQQIGLIYESNILLYGHESLRPVWRFRNLVSIPFYWSDDKYLEYSPSLNAIDFFLERPGLKVFNFHPIHIFANTPNPSFYVDTVKPNYQDADKLHELRYRIGPGCQDLFLSLLSKLQKGGYSVTTMQTLTELWMDQNG